MLGLCSISMRRKRNRGFLPEYLFNSNANFYDEKIIVIKFNCVLHIVDGSTKMLGCWSNAWPGPDFGEENVVEAHLALCLY